MQEVNRQINRCGIYYLGHYGVATVVAIGDTFRFEVPINRVWKFTRIFPEVDWEDGEFLEVLGGKYVRLVLAENGDIIGMRHITKDLTYWKDEQ